MIENRVIILLGTYNGERFIEQQIRSVQDQTYKNWEMYIRDDGSDDATLHVLYRIQKSDNRIHIVSGNKINLGILGNYNALCQIALRKDAHIVFFCDQDDVWLPQKIEAQINIIKSIEDRCGRECPVLVHSDLTVVDTRLKQIHSSFLAYRGIKNIDIAPLKVLLTQNFITACTSAFNHALLKLAVPIPSIALMHDWWMALCGAACGHIAFIEKPMVRYRQHVENRIGARGLLNSINPYRMNFKTQWQNAKFNFTRSMFQANSLGIRIREQNITIHPNINKIIEEYSNCLALGKFKRIQTMHRNGIRRQGVLYQIVFYLFLFFTPKSPLSMKNTD